MTCLLHIKQPCLASNTTACIYTHVSQCMPALSACVSSHEAHQITSSKRNTSIHFLVSQEIKTLVQSIQCNPLSTKVSMMSSCTSYKLWMMSYASYKSSQKSIKWCRPVTMAPYNPAAVKQHDRRQETAHPKPKQGYGHQGYQKHCSSQQAKNLLSQGAAGQQDITGHHIACGWSLQRATLVAQANAFVCTCIAPSSTKPAIPTLAVFLLMACPGILLLILFPGLQP